MNHDDDFEGWNETEGTFEGRAFPSEGDWLDLPAPPIADDFVARTMEALRGDTGSGDTGSGDPGSGDAESREDSAVVGHLLTPDILAAFKVPEASQDFVARTLQAVQEDRRSRWRELLAKHVAPEPSPEFVARTLRALANDGATVRRGKTVSSTREATGRWGVVPRPLSQRWFLSLMALAAAVTVIVILQPSSPAPLEQRVADSARPSLASTYSATPLPAVLAALEQNEDPLALPSGGADGMWLLLHREGR